MVYPVKYVGYFIEACWVVFFVYWIVNFFGNKTDLYRRRQAHFKTPVFILTVVIISVLAQHFEISPIISYSRLTQALGMLLCAIGIAWAIWARKTLSTNWSAVPSIKQDHRLIQTGPYAFSRHPIYTGWIAAFFGTFLAVMATWAGLAILLIITIAFAFRIPIEEKLMTQTFPEQYPDYKRRVRAALIPYLF